MTQGVFSSITRMGTLEPFDLQVARGQITGHTTVNIYGYQANVATSFIPIWELNTDYTFPSAAAVMKVTGTDADTAKVLVSGLDANYNMISETVTLNGTNAVNTTNSYFRINSMQVTSGNPAATVTLTNQAGNVTYAQIATGVGRTQMGVYTVPAGYTFYLQRVNIYTSLNGNNFATYQNKQISSNGVVQLTQQAPFAVSYEGRRIMPRPILEKTDILLQCKVNSSTGAIGISQEGYLIKNNSVNA